MTETLLDSLYLEIEQFIAFLPRLFLGLVVLFIFYLVGKGVSRIYDRVFKRTVLSETSLHYFNTFIVAVFVFIGGIVSLNILGFQGIAAALLAGGGLTAVMLGFVFKDIGENFLAGFLLAFRRPFVKGDLIKTEGLTGTVVNMELRHVHIRTTDGADIFIPSAQIFTRPLTNYTVDGLRRGNFSLKINYTHDAINAVELLLKTVREIKHVLKKPAPSVQITAFAADTVELDIFFWIRGKNQEEDLASAKTQVMNACRIALIKEGFISLPKS